MKKKIHSPDKKISAFVLEVATCLSALLATNTQAQNCDASGTINVGNIRMTISNYATFGSGFARWPDVKSLEYPRGSGIENMFSGGLWIGGRKNFNGNPQFAVSTAAVDVSSVIIGGQGFEFTPDTSSKFFTRSTLITSPFFRTDAISHQDFVYDCTDANTFLPCRENAKIQDHNFPLGVSVHAETYAWNFPFADYFVIMNYTIKNSTTEPIDSAYIGFWTDLVVRNTNLRAPRGTDFFASGANGFIDSLGLMYEYDKIGDNGNADNYASVKFLGSTPRADSVFFNNWQFRNTTGAEWSLSPQTDEEKYKRMSSTYTGTDREIIRQELTKAGNRSQMISVGPFRRINPGDSININFAYVLAKKSGTADLDNEETRKQLIVNAGWAQRAYNGTDVNGNGKLDSNEVDYYRNDSLRKGTIKRYILPTPPESPRVRTETLDGKIIVYWSSNAENSYDILSNRKHFEGYKVYRSNPGEELQISKPALSLVGSYDLPNNNLFNDNGFSAIRITDESGKPSTKTFDGDTVVYSYKMEFPNVLNGWLYTFAVTAFSSGDPVSGVPSLESSKIASEVQVIPGVKAQATGEEIGIYPNPYYTSAAWDAASNRERGRKIYFTNLPARATLKILTLSGDVIATLQHEAGISQGQTIQWFTQTGNTNPEKIQFAGGEHAWDLITENDQAITPGMYIIIAENKDDGSQKIGRFLILK